MATSSTEWVRVDAQHFIHAPRSWTVRDGLAFWTLDATLGGLTIWGAQDAVSARAVAAAFDDLLLRDVPRRDALLDLRRVSGIAPAAFAVIEAHLRERRAAYGGAIRRQLILRPGGLVGAAIAGFFVLLPSAWEVRVADDAEEGSAWLGRPEALTIVQWVDALAARAGREPHTEELVRWLDARVGRSDLSVLAAASGLATSVRTLQRRLEAEGTSFQEELLDARLRAARWRLANSAHKLERIARDTGFASGQHLSVAFRKRYGCTPSDFRAEHADASGRKPR